MGRKNKKSVDVEESIVDVQKNDIMVGDTITNSTFGEGTVVKINPPSQLTGDFGGSLRTVLMSDVELVTEAEYTVEESADEEGIVEEVADVHEDA